MSESMPERTWGVLAYIVGDHEGLTPEQADEINKAAMDEAQKLVRAARGLDDVYLSVHVDLTNERGSHVFRVPGRKEPERRPEDRADLAGLRKFFREERKRRPTKHNMVILWGHSSGPLGLFADPDGGPGTGQLRLRELGEMLPAMKSADADPPLDILLVKSCYMATLEAACEVERLADFMICSQARVPMSTWTIWEDVFEQLDGEPESVAHSILDAIDRHYSDVDERNGHGEVPFSLLRPRGVGELKEKFQALCHALRSHHNEPAVAAAIEQARPAIEGDKALLDVRQLCANLMNLDSLDVASCAAELDEAIKPALVIDNTPLISNFGGVGLFHFPTDPLLRADSFANEVTDSFYASLTFPRETGWTRLAFPAFKGPSPSAVEKPIASKFKASKAV